MATISTHVLDTALGRPAAGVSVVLEQAGGQPVAESATDDDGRVGRLGSEDLPAGGYRLRFDTAAYFVATGQVGFFPEVAIAFWVESGQRYHVPLLLSPFAYSTYRGS